MKIRNLGEKGIAHYVLPLVVIAVIGVVGSVVLIKSHAATCTTASFSYGKTSTCVWDIDTLANWKLAVSPKIPVNYWYSYYTKQGIKQMQKAFGLPQTGVVGQTEWLVLCSSSVALGKGGPFYGTALTAYNNAGCSALVTSVTY